MLDDADVLCNLSATRARGCDGGRWASATVDGSGASTMVQKELMLLAALVQVLFLWTKKSHGECVWGRVWKTKVARDSNCGQLRQMAVL